MRDSCPGNTTTRRGRSRRDGGEETRKAGGKEGRREGGKEYEKEGWGGEDGDTLLHTAVDDLPRVASDVPMPAKEREKFKN